MIIEFNDGGSASIKSSGVKKKNVIKATTRFMSGKLLMFSLKSFIYLLAETLYFPDEIVLEIYNKNQMEKIICYHILTDTESTSLRLIILSDPSTDFPESKIRDAISEMIVKTKIFKRFDTSHVSWEKCNARKPKRQKKLGLCEVKRVDNL